MLGGVDGLIELEFDRNLFVNKYSTGDFYYCLSNIVVIAASTVSLIGIIDVVTY